MAKIKPKHTFSIRWSRSPEKWISKRTKKMSEIPDFDELTRSEAYQKTKDWLENHGGGRITVFKEDGTFDYSNPIQPINEPPNLFNLKW